MKLISKASLQISKPIDQVFEGIINPEILTKYFISESTGRLESGIDVIWKFPEFPDRFPIKKVQIETNRSISFVWDPKTIVTITLESYTPQSTIIRVEENGKELNEENLKWHVSNTGGWANFLCCMKAYLEYGIRLRKGSYDFMSKE